MILTEQQITTFREKIRDFYVKNRRDFPWRNTTDFYKILVSEIMLQQTQTFRALPKYEMFIKTFPNFEALSNAPFKEVLAVWKGLGYNRRALYIHHIAKKIVAKNQEPLISRFHVSIHGNITPEFLESLPGIGKNTAASIIVFSKNTPLIFIETNIRHVFIHEFFSPSLVPSPLEGEGQGEGETIHDKQLLPLIEQTLDHKNPRDWYYALMDYGTHLGKTIPNPNRKSKHYSKQSKFEGSIRQVRGKILEVLLKEKNITKTQLFNNLKTSKEMFEKALSELHKEKFINITNDTLTLSK